MKFSYGRIVNRSALLAFALVLSLTSSGQTGEKPSRIAIISKSDVFQNASDLLTVELSKDSHLQILERAEIDKIYREQDLSTENNNFSKLGEILGADGLLLMDALVERTNKFLGIRLVAVKPGVIIESMRSPWPIVDLPGWSRLVAIRFAPLIPKLEVKRADAIPLSVLSLRSAVRNPQAEQLEKELTSLAIERLTHESSLFVLERRGMGLLSNEKELKVAEESDFWNGSYLLEGILDRDGYSPDSLTVSARLVAPQGEPRLIEVSGSRTNLPEIIQRLAGQVVAALKLKENEKEWDSAIEAEQYFTESKWAFQWGLIEEAQAASEAAWALGKKDLDCGWIRVKTSLLQAMPDTGGYQKGEYSNSTGDDTVTAAFIKAELREFPGRFVYDLVGKNKVIYVTVGKVPRKEAIDRSLAALNLYTDLCQRLQPDGPDANSLWYRLGVEALEGASQVLQHYHTVSSAQKAVAPDLAQLRASTRIVSAWLENSPSVQATYSLGFIESDSVWRRRNETNVFLAQAKWGCFWQEKPAETLDLYRKLLRSAASIYVYSNLTNREPHRPGLVAWDVADRPLQASLWNEFLSEVVRGKSRTRFRGVNVPILRESAGSNPSTHTALPPSVQRATPVPPTDLLTQQIEFLKNKTPFDSNTIDRLFLFAPPYSKEQAETLKPLFVAYQSNAVPQSGAAQGIGMGREESILKMVESRINAALKTAVDQRPITKTKAVPQSVTVPLEAITNVLFVNTFLSVPSNIFKKFPEQDVDRHEGFLNWWTVNHLISQGRLWLDLRFDHQYSIYSEVRSHWVKSNRAAAVTFDLKTLSSEIIEYPEHSASPWSKSAVHAGGLVPARGFSAQWVGGSVKDLIEFFEIVDGAVFVSGWDYLRKFDLKTRQWERRDAPWQSQTRLFAAGNRLFAASSEAIFEILEDGKNFKTLASCRRRPAVTQLDLLESFGEVILFGGFDRSLNALVANQLYSWNDREWHSIASDRVHKLDLFEDTAVIRASLLHYPPHLLLLALNKTNLELGLLDNTVNSRAGANQPPLPSQKPIWPTPIALELKDAAVVATTSNLFVLQEYGPYGYANQEALVMEKSGRHSHLFYFERGQSDPCIIPLKFDTTKALLLRSAQTNARLTWMSLTPEWLLIGQNSVPGVWAIPRTELNKAIELWRLKHWKTKKAANE